MSAIMSYRRIRLEQLAQLIDAPWSVYDWLDADAATLEYDSHRSWGPDVMWHILHYVLNGEAWGGEEPLWNAVLGGGPFWEGAITEDRPGHFITNAAAIGEVVRYLVPNQVKEVARALDQLNEIELRRRFSISAMLKADIYSVLPRDEPDEETLFREEFMFTFTQIKEMFQETAQANDGVLIYLA